VGASASSGYFAFWSFFSRSVQYYIL
jgi:hypothetical protein